MKKSELLEKLEIIKSTFIKVEYMIEAIEISLIELELEKNGTEEHVVRYDAQRVIEEFLYKEKELIYFINQFINNIKYVIENNHCDAANRTIMLNDNRFVYYFDGVITQMYLISESEQRVQIQNYINKGKKIDFYPNRNSFGLWWEIYMLRNRIVHYTETRYTPNKEVCYCFNSFSSKCNVINIDENNNINLNSNLIDIYKDKNIKELIEKTIVSNENPFDLLFPNKSAKGKGKKRPMVTFIDKDIWFDYATSGVRLLNEINDFLTSINNLFFFYIYDQIKDKKKIVDLNIVDFINVKEAAVSIKELFNIEN